MTGDAPQPGETPRSEVDPWAFADPGASWWRGETDRADDTTESDQVRQPHRRAPANLAPTGGTGILLPPGFDRDDSRLDRLPPLDRPPLVGPQPPGVVEAQAAAARDVADELGRPDPATEQRTGEHPTLEQRTGDHPTLEQRTGEHPTDGAVAGETPADEAGVERHHDQPDPFRYDLPTVTADQGPVPTDDRDDLLFPAEPNVRNRPTVALDRGPVPGQSPTNHTWLHPGEPLPRPTGTPATDARLEKLENSPFWLSEQERAAAPPPTVGPAHLAAGRRGPRRTARRTAPALIALIVLGLLSTFFAWVSAEPFWIAVGHGDPGYATTAHCVSSGVTQRCTGTFAAADGHFAVNRVTLLGVAGEQRVDGTIAPARMVSADSRQAYLGDTGALVQLRWILGFVLVLICGYGIAGLTGARQLETARARRGAVLVSLAGPLILLAGFVLAAY